MLSALAVYFFITVRQGIEAGFRFALLAVAGAFAVAGAVAVAGAFAVAVAVAVAGAVAGAVAVAVAGAGAGAFAFAFAFAFAVAVGIIAICTYIAWRALKGDPKHALVRNLAIALGAIGGTSFRRADLTQANLTQAVLKSTDFRDATVTQTHWHHTKRLDRSRVGGTILLDPDVRDLLVTGQGRSKRYRGRNLKGANLTGADLTLADLTEADISGATLVGACLERANLTKTQTLGANFHQAILTGACLEAWNIDSTTQLDGAICDYVYLLNDHRERRPSSGDFAPGEFTKLFQEVLSTVDLIFRNGIDWRAFTYSFNQVVVENEGLDLSIQSIENKGDGVVVVRVDAPPDANKAKLHTEFNQNYEVALQALEAKYQAELQAKDEQYRVELQAKDAQILAIYREKSADMKEIVSLLANRPVNVPVNVEVQAQSESKSMNDSTDQSRQIKIGDVGGDFNAGGAALSLGDISGTVTHTINQLQTADHPQASQLADLLQQLQAAIEAEPDLSDADKTEALEQVDILGKAGQTPQDGLLKRSASTAVKILRGDRCRVTDHGQIGGCVQQATPHHHSAFRVGIASSDAPDKRCIGLPSPQSWLPCTYISDCGPFCPALAPPALQFWGEKAKT